MLTSPLFSITLLVVLLTYATPCAFATANVPVRALQRSAVNCCSLDNDALEAMKGTNSDCPSTLSSVSTLSEKCQKCPAGLCRIGATCYCPDNFLSDSSAQAECKSYFGKSWPDSKGIEDVFYRSCLDNAPKISASSISCCSLPETTLLQMRGLTDKCPTTSSLGYLSSKCETCPAGTCRVYSSLNYCYCPEAFLSSTTVQAYCQESFGATYPDSIGKQETSTLFGSCENRVVPTITLPDGSTMTPAPPGTTASSDTAPEADSTGKPSVSPSSAAVPTTGSTGASSSSSTGSGGANPSSSPTNNANGLSTLEIVGIIAGVVSAVVAVLGGLNFRRVKTAVEARRAPALATESI